MVRVVGVAGNVGVFVVAISVVLELVRTVTIIVLLCYLLVS